MVCISFWIVDILEEEEVKAKGDSCLWKTSNRFRLWMRVFFRFVFCFVDKKKEEDTNTKKES